MVEILCASFQNGSYLGALSGVDETGKNRTFNVGHYFMAINVAFFTDLDQFKKTTRGILRELQASKKAPGQDHIYFAGEKECASEKYIRENGIAIIPNLQSEIKTIQDELSLKEYDLPF